MTSEDRFHLARLSLACRAFEVRHEAGLRPDRLLPGGAAKAKDTGPFPMSLALASQASHQAKHPRTKAKPL